MFGYVRRTLSFPATFDAAMQEFLASTPGTTMSAVMTVAGEEYLERLEIENLRKKGR